jgi:hypothetical protein
MPLNWQLFLRNGVMEVSKAFLLEAEYTPGPSAAGRIR